MRKLSKVVLVILCLFSITISAVAKEDDSNFSVNGIAYSQDEVETLKLRHAEQAEAYKKGLGACYGFNYATNVEESEDKFETITVETADEKEAVVSEKEEEGYSVEVEGKEHETTTEEYKFNVFNGRVTSATKDGSAIGDYNGRRTTSVLADNEFTDYEDDDVKVVNTVTENIQVINGSQVLSSRAGANFYAYILSAQGYDTNVTQNNTERTNFEITSRRVLGNLEIISRANITAIQNNPNKEILDLRVNSTNNARTLREEEYTTRDEADGAAATLRNTGLYERVDVSEEIDTNKDNATKVTQEPVAFTWTHNDTEPYTEAVETNGVETGYRNYYAVVTPVTEDNVRVQRLTREQCNTMLNSNEYESYTNKQCTREFSLNPFDVRFTFTAHRDADTIINGFYDEYVYALKYKVSAYYYRYTGSYIATDYTVSYTGNRGTIDVSKATTDKYYDINGTRPLYNVATTGTKEDNGSCVTTTATTSEEAKTVDTGVRENSYYKVVLITSLSVLFITVLSRKKLCK